MTIKAFVLDALGKFWNKLKGSYITPMQTKIDNLNIGNCTTLAEFYEKIDALPLYATAIFTCDPTVSAAISGNRISSYLKGFVVKMDDSQKIFDVCGTQGGSYIRLLRIRFDTPTNVVIQYINSGLSTNGLSMDAATVQCQNSNASAEMQDRLITHSYGLADNVTDYKTLQLISGKNGIKLEAQRRSDDVWEHLWNTAYTPFLGVGGTEITSNQDLDSFITPGNYYCKGNTTVATLTNCPTVEAFKMFVSHPTGGSTSYIGQEIKEFSHNKIYYRWRGTDNVWRSWETLAPITGGASTVATSNLTASRALISNTSGKIGVSSATTTELGYLSGVTSAIQTQLNGKQASITGGASTITSSNLTASRALISNASGKVGVSSATTTELGYLSGVTSAIQTQLNSKQATLSWAIGKTQSTVSSMTITTANTYYKIGTESVTFAAGTYIAVMHVFGGMASSSPTPTCTLTVQMGSSATDGNVMRKATMKTAVNTSAGLYVHWTDVIKFTASTTYYMWVTSNAANTVLNNMTWTIDAIKIA